MRFGCLLLALLVIAPSARAADDDFCRMLWLSRNIVFDRAGQCFQSALGQSVFDNADCIGTARNLFPFEAEVVRMAQEMEISFDCDVDTANTALGATTTRFLAQLRQLNTPPVRADTEHGCWNYLGPPRALYAGISTDLAQIGTLQTGQNFGFSHLPLRGGWEFISVSNPDGSEAGFGWVTGLEMSFDTCEQIAG